MNSSLSGKCLICLSHVDLHSGYKITALSPVLPQHSFPFLFDVAAELLNFRNINVHHDRFFCGTLVQYTTVCLRIDLYFRPVLLTSACPHVCLSVCACVCPLARTLPCSGLIVNQRCTRWFKRTRIHVQLLASPTPLKCCRRCWRLMRKVNHTHTRMFTAVPNCLTCKIFN